MNNTVTKPFHVCVYFGSHSSPGVKELMFAVVLILQFSDHQVAEIWCFQIVGAAYHGYIAIFKEYIEMKAMNIPDGLEYNATLFGGVSLGNQPRECIFGRLPAASADVVSALQKG